MTEQYKGLSLAMTEAMETPEPIESIFRREIEERRKLEETRLRSRKLNTIPPRRTLVYGVERVAESPTDLLEVAKLRLPTGSMCVLEGVKRNADHRLSPVVRVHKHNAPIEDPDSLQLDFRPFDDNATLSLQKRGAPKVGHHAVEFGPDSDPMVTAQILIDLCWMATQSSDALKQYRYPNAVVTTYMEDNRREISLARLGTPQDQPMRTLYDCRGRALSHQPSPTLSLSH